MQLSPQEPRRGRRAAVAASALLGTVLVAGGCATDDSNRSRNTGAIMGAIAGAIVGNNTGGEDTASRVFGAGVGALVGGSVGKYMDDQRAELERNLADERNREQLGITEVGDNTLKIGIAGDATFAFDRSEIQPQFKPTYGKIASTLSDFNKTIVHVVGHTDSVGPADYNERLSRDRAESVGTYLRDRGVDGNRIIYYGMGEDRPVAGNDTESGRERNRRVEIYLKPIVEGQERQAYTPPPGVYG